MNVELQKYREFSNETLERDVLVALLQGKSLWLVTSNDGSYPSTVIGPLYIIDISLDDLGHRYSTKLRYFVNKNSGSKEKFINDLQKYSDARGIFTSKEKAEIYLQEAKKVLNGFIPSNSL